MIHINHLAQLVALCGAGLFASTIGFAALWIRARDRATRAESLLEGMRMMGARDGTLDGHRCDRRGSGADR